MLLTQIRLCFFLLIARSVLQSDVCWVAVKVCLFCCLCGYPRLPTERCFNATWFDHWLGFTRKETLRFSWLSLLLATTPTTFGLGGSTLIQLKKGDSNITCLYSWWYVASCSDLRFLRAAEKLGHFHFHARLVSQYIYVLPRAVCPAPQGQVQESQGVTGA